MIAGIAPDDVQPLLDHLPPFPGCAKFFQPPTPARRPEGRQAAPLLAGMLDPQCSQEVLQVDGVGRVSRDADSEHFDGVIDIFRDTLGAVLEALGKPRPFRWRERRRRLWSRGARSGRWRLIRHGILNRNLNRKGGPGEIRREPVRQSRGHGMLPSPTPRNRPFGSRQDSRV